jgi:cation:H+ antiporter
MFNYFLLFSGIIALIGYFIYFIRNFKHYRKEKEMENDNANQKLDIHEDELKDLKSALKFKKILYVIIGLIFIFIGGEILVFSGEKIIDLLKIPEIFFGFIIVGFVTNVEEMTLVIKSIKKKSIEIGFGGMVGKLIWNLTITFGVSGIIIMDIGFNSIFIWNWLILFVIIIYFNLCSIRRKLERRDGILLLVIFTLFILSNSLFL